MRPERPTVHAHFTGSKVGSGEDRIPLLDRHGNLITMDLPEERSVVTSGLVVTAVIRQDLKTDGLSLLGTETADDKIGRLVGALTNSLSSGSSEVQDNLKVRLTEATTGHLTTLYEVIFRVDPGIRFVFADALEAARVRHLDRLSGFDLGPPTAMLTAGIQDVAAGGTAVFVSPFPGIEQAVNLKGDTRIGFFGEPGTPDQLDLGQRIVYQYDLAASTAISLDVVFPALGRDIVRSLLPQVGVGEIEGVISSVNTDPPALQVELGTGTSISLAIDSDTRVLVAKLPAGLDDLFQGTPVKVIYDPSSLTALSIDTYDPGQPFLTGVLSGIIRKIRPGIVIPGSDEVGNISIVTPSGEARTLNITDDTVIEREGRRMNIGAPTLGDLVKATTRYDRATGNLHRLVVAGPGHPGDGARQTRPAEQGYPDHIHRRAEPGHG